MAATLCVPTGQEDLNLIKELGSIFVDTDLPKLVEYSIEQSQCPSTLK
jgi:hypothetical protein